MSPILKMPTSAIARRLARTPNPKMQRPLTEMHWMRQPFLRMPTSATVMHLVRQPFLKMPTFVTVMRLVRTPNLKMQRPSTEMGSRMVLHQMTQPVIERQARRQRC